MVVGTMPKLLFVPESPVVIPKIPPSIVMLEAEDEVEPNVLLELLKTTVPVLPEPLLIIGEAFDAPLLITPPSIRVSLFGALMLAAPVIAILLLKETVVVPACK